MFFCLATVLCADVTSNMILSLLVVVLGVTQENNLLLKQNLSKTDYLIMKCPWSIFCANSHQTKSPETTTDSCSMSVRSQDESIASENAFVFLKLVSRLEKHSSAKTQEAMSIAQCLINSASANVNYVLHIVKTECLYDVNILVIFCLRWSDFSG